MDAKILQVAETKMRAAMYHATNPKARARFDDQMKKAYALVIAEAVQPYKSNRYPDSFQVKSQTRERIYSPNVSTMDCQCEHGDHQRHLPIEERELCAHLSSGFLYRYCQNEIARQQKELEAQDWRVALQTRFERAGLAVAK